MRGELEQQASSTTGSGYDGSEEPGEAIPSLRRVANSN